MSDEDIRKKLALIGRHVDIPKRDWIARGFLKDLLGPKRNQPLSDNMRAVALRMIEKYPPPETADSR